MNENHSLTNNQLAKKCIEQLYSRNVRLMIICAGARNAPLVVAAEEFAREHSNFEILNFFEERGAAFFALGRMKALGAPVAVVTTSGTAVGELLPAMMEAHHSNMPLIAVTADRPKLHRGSGSPQSTEQVGIFSHFVEKTFDWDQDSYSNLETWHGHRPLHFNICFSEPLL